MRTQPLIILVDDEDDFLEIASVRLKRSGFDTFTTNDSRAAVAKAEELQPDLVLSDVYMVPGPNGWELALALRRNPRTRDLKVAFFTTLRDPMSEIPVEARDAVVAELGAPTFLSKIDDMNQLPEIISRLVNGV